MTRERLIEALISVGVGVIIAVLSAVIEVLKEVEYSTTNELVNSGSGMVAYTLQRIRHHL
jgi:hypothetical protein